MLRVAFIPLYNNQFSMLLQHESRFKYRWFLLAKYITVDKRKGLYKVPSQLPS